MFVGMDCICKCVGWVGPWQNLVMLTIFSNVDDARLERMRAWKFWLPPMEHHCPIEYVEIALILLDPSRIFCT